MKRYSSVVLFLAIALLFGISSGVMAETKTLSWGSVTTYTDGSTIVAPALPVTYDAWWSTSTTFVTPHNLIANTTSTSVVFDIVTQGMLRNTTIFFGARARTPIPGEVSADSPPYSWLVPNLVLVSITVNGPASVNEGATGTFTATATWNDNSTSTITPTWSVSPIGIISAGGVLTAPSVTADTPTTVTASYTWGGVTKTDPQVVMIANVLKIPSTPISIGIGN
jgi:hypothetical protein